jgi:hypothetical protein
LALSEFVAMETAYQALRQLDPGARQRALHWLTDALGVAGALPQSSTEPEAPSTPAVPASSRRGRPRPPLRGTAASANTARRGAKAVNGGERAYRRMPDPADVLAAYRQVGSVSALADHYGVPRHTVQGWARRLRREGYDIGRSA